MTEEQLTKGNALKEKVAEAKKNLEKIHHAIERLGQNTHDRSYIELHYGNRAFLNSFYLDKKGVVNGLKLSALHEEERIKKMESEFESI